MLQQSDSSEARRISPSPNYDSPSGKRSQLIVVHDVESPLAQEYCDSLAGPDWFGGNPNCDTSAHYICGPEWAVQMVAEEDRAWHCGPAGNILSIGIEQTGRAAFTRDDWLTADGRAQIEVPDALMSDVSVRHGGPANPQRATNAQIQAYANGGSLPGGVMWCTHHQITESLGGTTHTDPDPNYPYDVLQTALDERVPHEAPNPTPPTPPEDDEDMPTAQEIVDELLNRKFTVRDATEPDTTKATKTFTLTQLIVDEYNKNSMAARDAYAVRNATEAKAIRQTVDAALQDPDNGDAVALRVWNTKITGTTQGAGAILGALFGRSCKYVSPPQVPNDIQPNGV